MKHVFLVGTGVCLVVSWIYILILRAQIRDAMAYIQNRLARANPGLDSVSGLREVDHDAKGISDPGRPTFKGTASPALVRATMDEKPRLIVDISGSFQSLHYVCSHCLLRFNPHADQPQKEAMEELLRTFKQHAEREHLSAAPATTSSSEVAGQSQPSSIKPLRVLLAEVDPLNQLLAVRLLERHGHRVVLAENGLEVVDRIKGEQFDLFLVDVELPELDGLSATLRIRKDERATDFHLPILAMGAFPKEGDRERWREAGVDGFVSKPFNYKELSIVVQAVLSSPEAAPGSETVVDL